MENYITYRGEQKVYLPEHLDEEFPLYGIPIHDVMLGAFTTEFEINPVNGDTRPEGGNYFDVIRIIMEND